MGKLSDLADQQLGQRSQEAFDSKDSTGMYETYLKKDMDGVTLWKCENGGHVVNIIPFRVGENFPNQPPYEHIKPDDMAYYIDLYTHRNIGVNETTVLCLSRNWGLPCPICEHIKNLRSEGGDENLATAKALSPKRRTVYNILCMDSDEEERKGIQVWEVAHFFMQKHLAARSKNRKTGAWIPFASAKNGSEVLFDRTKTGDNVEFSNHAFEAREGYVIKEEQLEQAVCIDEVMTIHSYGTLHQMFWGKDKAKESIEKAVENDPVIEDDIPIDVGEEKVSPRKSRVAEAQKAPVVENKCPHGGTFGMDANKLKQCPECPEETWEACEKEKVEYDKANPPTTGRRRKV